MRWHLLCLHAGHRFAHHAVGDQQAFVHGKAQVNLLLFEPVGDQVCAMFAAHFFIGAKGGFFWLQQPDERRAPQ